VAAFSGLISCDIAGYTEHTTLSTMVEFVWRVCLTLSSACVQYVCLALGLQLYVYCAVRGDSFRGGKVGARRDDSVDRNGDGGES